MAPHALTDVHDVSGYTPSERHIDKLLMPAKLSGKSKTYLTGGSALSSKNLPKATTIGKSRAPQPAYFWRLSFEEVGEIEDAVGWFQRKC